jgi:ABC-2 type transport system ATP-binding protein
MATVVLENVTKIIKGSTVLSNISLSLECGKAYGFYGHNGSGKSMLFRTIAGLIRPTSGKVVVFDKEIGKDSSFPENMGLIIETVGFWPYYTGFENLKTLAAIRHVISNEEIKETIKRVGLDPNDKRPYSKYSLGMKQRLGIAQALMEKPKLLLLDEPTNALDDEGIKLFRQLICEEIEKSTTVLISSHNKEELSILCSSFFKMSAGLISDVTEEIRHEI